MAMFIFKETPTYGACVTCGASQNPKGFIDMIAEVDITRENKQIVGNVDVVICSDCLEQAAEQIGCTGPEKSFAMAWNNSELEAALEKASDEAHSWQQRYENLVEIMSLVRMNSKEVYSEDAGSGDSPSDGFINGPEPDLRVPEGRDLLDSGAGKAKGGRGRKRKPSDGSNPGDEGL